MAKNKARPLTSTPSDLVLLQGAYAAVTQRLPKLLSESASDATVRQLTAVLSELIHRQTQLQSTLFKHIHAGQRLLAEVRALTKANGARRAPRQKKLASTASRERLEREHQQLAIELRQAVDRMWQKASPRQSARCERLARKVLQWDNALTAAMGAPAVEPTEHKRPKRAQQPALDHNALAEFIRGRGELPEDLTIAHMQRLSGGFSRATWLLQTRSEQWGERGLVLRQQLPAGVLDGLFALLREEYPLLQLLNESGLPVPKQWLCCKTPNPLRSDFILMDRAQGQTAGLPTGDSRFATETFLRDLATALAKLHAIDWSAHARQLKGSKTWHPSTGLTMHSAVTELIDHWAGFAEREVEIPMPGVSAVIGWLRANVPDRAGKPSILHGDVGFHNMLVHEGRLTAFLDWETAHLGDPAKDVAHVKPTIERHMPWERFMQWYVDAGGQRIDPETLRYYEVLKAVTHVIVTILARGNRFERAPGERFELTEMGLVHLPFFSAALQRVF